MTSREQFEAFIENPHMLNRRDEPGYYDEYEHPYTCGAWAAWKAAEAATARRCVEIADQIGTHDGDVMVHRISAEYPEAFK